jgi:predicted Zn-dependent protease
MQRTRHRATVAAGGKPAGGTRAAWVAAAAISSLVGCGSTMGNAGPGPATTAAPALSPEEEALLGANLDAIINAETKAAPEALQDYLQGIFDRLLEAAGSDRAGMILSLKVLDNPETGNVFATPSGSVYVTSGVLMGTADEAEAAAILAHELGHVVQGHPTARLLRGLGRDQLKELGVSQTFIARDQRLSSALTGAMYGLLTGGAQLRYLPEEEIAADARAIGYLEREGFDTGGLGTLLSTPSKLDPGPLVVLHAGHPLSLERLGKLPARQGRRKPRATAALASLKETVANDRRRLAKKARSGATEPGLDKASARR